MKKYTLKLIVTLCLIFLLITMGYGFYVAFNILLLIFSGLLTALFFDSIAFPLQKYTPLPKKIALGISVLILFSIGAIFFRYFLPALYEQFAVFIKILPEAFNNFKDKITSIPYAKNYLNDLPTPQHVIKNNIGIVSETQNILTIISSFLGSLVVVFFIGLYLALEPTLYINGFLKMFPKKQHALIRKWLNTCEKDLKGWLWGRMASMTAIGLGVSLGLWLLDIPLAIFLGILAGVLSFIPYIGPLISAGPPILFALSSSTEKALWVLLLFFVLQILESYILTPLIQKKVVSLPPALTLGFLAFFSACNGILGTALAAPILVFILASVNVLYVDHILNKKSPSGENS